MTKSILITGASSGIGKAVAFEMAKRGYALALTARRLELLEAIRTDILQLYPSSDIEIRHLDVTDYESVSATIGNLAEALDGLDIVFVNAGVGFNESIGVGEFEKSRKTIEVNLIGAMATVDAAVAHFIENDSGHVVGITSVAAFRGMPTDGSYGASKAGLANYLEALRVEVYQKNIDVTVLYPGFIDTPLTEGLPSAPFMISAEKAAVIMAGMIEKKTKSSTVPAFPWNVIGRLLKILPAGVIAKIS